MWDFGFLISLFSGFRFWDSRAIGFEFSANLILGVSCGVGVIRILLFLAFLFGGVYICRFCGLVEFGCFALVFTCVAFLG